MTEPQEDALARPAERTALDEAINAAIEGWMTDAIIDPEKVIAGLRERGYVLVPARAAARGEPGLDVERLARAMEDVFPGWIEEAPGSKEAQAEMRSYATDLVKAYDFLRDSASSE